MIATNRSSAVLFTKELPANGLLKPSWVRVVQSPGSGDYNVIIKRTKISLSQPKPFANCTLNLVPHD